MENTLTIRGAATIQEVGENGGAIIADGVRVRIDANNEEGIWVHVDPDGVRAIMDSLAMPTPIAPTPSAKPISEAQDWRDYMLDGGDIGDVAARCHENGGESEFAVNEDDDCNCIAVIMFSDASVLTAVYYKDEPPLLFVSEDKNNTPRTEAQSENNRPLHDFQTP